MGVHLGWAHSTQRVVAPLLIFFGEAEVEEGSCRRSPPKSQFTFNLLDGPLNVAEEFLHVHQELIP